MIAGATGSVLARPWDVEGVKDVFYLRLSDDVRGKWIILMCPNGKIVQMSVTYLSLIRFREK